MYTFSQIVILYKYSHTSLEYKRMGWIFESNILKKVLRVICSNRLCSLKTSNRAILPFKAGCLALSCKLIDVVKVKSKYTYLFTISSWFPSIDHCSYQQRKPPFLKIIILDFSVFIFSPISIHNLCAQSSCTWSPCGEHDKSARLSAKSKMKSSIKPGSSCIPCFPSFATLCDFINYNRKQRRLNTHPCLRPWGQSNISVNSPFTLTHDKTLRP